MFGNKFTSFPPTVLVNKTADDTGGGIQLTVIKPIKSSGLGYHCPKSWTKICTMRGMNNKEYTWMKACSLNW